MPKVVTSPVKRWSGTVTLADPLTIAQVQKIEEALTPPESGADGKVWISALDAGKIPALIACAMEWKLEDFPEAVTLDTFPASPRKDSHALVEALFAELIRIYAGEVEIPNG